MNPPPEAPRTLDVPARLSELAPLRRYVRDLAHQAGFDDERTYDIALTVSEAAANAIEHGQTEESVRVSIEAGPKTFRVEVSGSAPFQLATRDGAELRGLGLPLMVSLADEVSFRSDEKGSAVVLRFVRL